MLERVAEGVYTETRPVRFWGVETGTRMNVVRLRDGGLFVHSPVGLDEETRRAIDALGEVRAVVAPSVFHHLYVGQWMAAYPRAVVAACPGLEWKRTDLAFHAVLGDQASPLWAEDLEQVYFSSRRENEVVFFHRATGTMLTCDALLNLGNHPERLTRLAARFMGNTAPGFGWPERIMIRDRRLARRQVDRILEWPVERILLAHGDPVATDGVGAIRRAYAWL